MDTSYLAHEGDMCVVSFVSSKFDQISTLIIGVLYVSPYDIRMC